MACIRMRLLCAAVCLLAVAAHARAAADSKAGGQPGGTGGVSNSKPQKPVIMPPLCNDPARCGDGRGVNHTDPGPGCMCDMQYSPVCGKDGQVYDNECLAQCDQTSVRWNCCKGGANEPNCGTAALGSCQKGCKEAADAEDPPNTDCGCADIYQPVCTEAGVVYGNECEAGCKQQPVSFDCGGRKPEQCKADCREQGACTCPELFHPVCGVTGEVYENDCKAGCANDPLRYDCPTMNMEECAPGCKAAAEGPIAVCDCPDDIRPVCTEGGRVYPNTCGAKCDKQPIRFQCGGLTDDECAIGCKQAAQDPGPICMCKAKYDPVCAMDGTVFPNGCTASCRGAPVRADCGELSTEECQAACSGAATGDCACMLLYSPVCGVSGRVYSNPCMAKCDMAEERWPCPDGEDCTQACQEAANPPVDPPVDPNCMCPMIAQPVCATSGAVYGNKCLAGCNGDPALSDCGEASYEECKQTCAAAAGGCACPKSYRPVCATSGRIYDNQCLAECGQASVRWECDSGLAPEQCADQCKKAVADPPVACRCANLDAPVCADNGRVYGNPCLASCDSASPDEECGDRTAEQCQQECQDKVYPPGGGCGCTEDIELVCTTGGKLYSNACQAKCDGTPIRFVCGDSGEEECSDKCIKLADTEEPPPDPPLCPCNKMYRPVCGMNGQTYGNDCMAECDNTGVYWQCQEGEECAPACWMASKPIDDASPGGVGGGGDSSGGGGCACNKMVKPVCAKSGKVYSNACLAKCANAPVRWACAGRKDCSKECTAAAAAPTKKPTAGSCLKKCPKKRVPVCSKAGKVYDNTCQLKCDKKESLRWACGKRKTCVKDCAAAAKPKCTCKAERKPVCAKTGKLYDNECQAKCAKAPVRFGCGKRKDCAKSCKAAAKKKQLK